MPSVDLSATRTLSKNTLVLVSGQVVSNLFRVIYIGALARYVGPEGVGVLSTGTALVSLGILVVNFGLGTTIVRDVSGNLERGAKYATNAVAMRLMLSFVVAALLLVAIGQSKYPFETQMIIGLYAFTYILDALSDVFYGIFRAYQKMEYPALIDLGRDIFNVVFSLVGILLGWSLVLIVVVSLVASLVKFVASAVSLRARFLRPELAIDLGFCGRLLLCSVPFALQLSIAVVYDRLGLVVISWVSSAEAVGIYSAAAMPISILFLVPTAFMDSAFPLFSKYFQASAKGPRSEGFPTDDNGSSDPLPNAYQFSFKALLVLGFAMGSGIILVSPVILPIIYGDGFEGSVLVLNLLSIQIFTIVGFVNAAYLNATNRHRTYVILRGVVLGLYVLLCFTLIPTYGYRGAAFAVVIPTAIDFFLYSALCHRLAGLAFPALLMARTALATLVMAACVYLTLAGGLFWPLAVVLVAPLAYLLALLALRVVSPRELRLLGQIFARTPSARAGKV